MLLAAEAGRSNINDWAVPFALFYGLRRRGSAPVRKFLRAVYQTRPNDLGSAAADWNHLILLILYAAFILLLLCGRIRLASGIASAVVALFLVRSGFAFSRVGSLPPPDLWLGAAAVLALGRLLSSAPFGDSRLWS